MPPCRIPNISRGAVPSQRWGIPAQSQGVAWHSDTFPEGRVQSRGKRSRAGTTLTSTAWAAERGGRHRTRGTGSVRPDARGPSPLGSPHTHSPRLMVTKKVPLRTSHESTTGPSNCPGPQEHGLSEPTTARGRRRRWATECSVGPGEGPGTRGP